MAAARLVMWTERFVEDLIVAMLASQYDRLLSMSMKKPCIYTYTKHIHNGSLVDKLFSTF